jgi:hypothetical protein
VPLWPAQNHSKSCLGPNHGSSWFCASSLYIHTSGLCLKYENADRYVGLSLLCSKSTKIAAGRQYGAWLLASVRNGLNYGPMEFSGFSVCQKHKHLLLMKWTLLCFVQKLKSMGYMSVVLFSAQNPVGPKKITRKYDDLCCFLLFKMIFWLVLWTCPTSLSVEKVYKALL